EAELDNTCGPGPNGEPVQGELAEAVWLSPWYDRTCQFTETDAPLGRATLPQAATTPIALGDDLPPGSSACFGIEVYIDEDALHRHAAQTDRVTWRFVWGATADLSP